MPVATKMFLKSKSSKAATQLAGSTLFQATQGGKTSEKVEQWQTKFWHIKFYMKKLSVNDLIKFKRKSATGKKSFVQKIKSNIIERPTEGGGDYWISSISAICKSYRTGNLNLIDEKVGELQEKLTITKHTITRNMYQRNIMILQKYKSIDLKEIRPGGKVSFLKKSTGTSVLTIKGLQIKAKPCHIYTFGKKDEEKVGAIWFTAKVNGYRIEELGMFCDMLYRVLKHNYSRKYQLISKFCVAVDMVSGRTIDYSEFENGGLFPALAPTLDEINKLM